MKKFRFTLDRLKDYKEQVFDEEKNRLAQLRMELGRIEDRIAALQRAFAACAQEMQQRQQEGIRMFQLQSYNLRLEHIRHQLETLEGERRRAEQAVQRQVQVVVAASQEVEGLEKLEEKQVEEYNYQLMKENELIISEFISQKLAREKIS